MSNLVFLGNPDDTERLESIVWLKPAFIEIVLSKHDDPSRPMVAPSLSKFTDLPAVLEGSKLQVSGGVRKRYYIYRMGKNIPFSQSDSGGGPHYEQWSANTVLSQRDIQRHPSFPALRKKYNGSVINDVVSWPRYIQDPDSEDKKVIKNPMFGVRAFFAPEVEVSVETGVVAGAAAKKFSQIDDVGYVDEPGGGFGCFYIPPSQQDKANLWARWILVEHSFRLAGNDRMERKAWRSAWGEGWPRPVYKKEAQEQA
jgi:hypothetical protein